MNTTHNKEITWKAALHNLKGNKWSRYLCIYIGCVNCKITMWIYTRQSYSAAVRTRIQVDGTHKNEWNQLKWNKKWEWKKKETDGAVKPSTTSKNITLSLKLPDIFLFLRALKSSQHSLCSLLIVDTPGFQNPRLAQQQRGATFEELCHNYTQERLQTLFHERTFVQELERYKEVLLVLRSTTQNNGIDRTWTC